MGTTGLKKRCVILGGGEIADYSAVAAKLNRDDFIICADSGFSHCENLGVVPNLLVGDFDSIGAAPHDVKRLDYPAEKDYTDSTLAIKTAYDMGYRRLLLAGMLGGRLDHSLANLQNLAWCAKNGADALMTDGKTEILAVKNGVIMMPPRLNAYFSVISLVDQCGEVTITGAKYPLTRYPLRFDEPRAISNEFAGGEVKVEVNNGVIAVIITPDAISLKGQTR